MPKRRIKHNDLLPWFLEDHGQLPASYLKSTAEFLNARNSERFIKGAKSCKPQAASNKPQAASAKLSPQLNVLTTKEYKKLERKYKNENK